MTVREYKRLLAQLVQNGRVNQEIQHRLETAAGRFERVLIQALEESNDPLMRELAATILGERRKTESLAALVQATRDPSEHVRFDALVAIDKCLHLEVGSLSTVLALNVARPKQLARRVEAWWKLVRHDF